MVGNYNTALVASVKNAMAPHKSRGMCFGRVEKTITRAREVPVDRNGGNRSVFLDNIIVV